MSELKWNAPENQAYTIFEEFPNIPTRKFESKDFRMVVKAFSDVYAEWQGIGHCIRIHDKTMNNLKKKCRQNSFKGLMCVVDEWFKGGFDGDEDENLYPCWRSVVHVVADDMGGRDPSAADKIAKHYKEYEKDLFHDSKVAEQADNTVSLRVGYERKLENLCKHYLKEVGHKWFEIGVLLGVPISVLSDLESDFKIKEVITQWLHFCGDPQFKGLLSPTMRTLLAAVENGMGGANSELVRKIINESSFVKSLGEGQPKPDSQDSAKPSLPKQPAVTPDSSAPPTFPGASTGAIQQQQQQQQQRQQQQQQQQLQPAKTAAFPGIEIAVATQPVTGIRIHEKDVTYLLGLIGNKAFKWKGICGQCGLLPSEVQAIATDITNLSSGNVHSQCLTVGLTMWCKISPTDGQHASSPTLEVLVKALRSQVVGEGVLADSIWKRRHELPSLAH